MHTIDSSRRWRVRAARLLCGCAGAALVVTAAPAQEEFEAGVSDFAERAQEAAQAVPGEIIVKPREPAVVPRLLDAEEAIGLGLEAAPRVTSGGEFVYQLRPSVMFELQSEEAAEERIDSIIEQLNERDDVEYAQPNWIVQPHLTPNDPGYPFQWHYFDNGSGSDQSPGGVNLPTAWDGGTGDTQTAVAVLDTGILPNHPDVAGSGNLGQGFDMITDPTRANDGDGRDPDPTDPGDAVAQNECGPGRPARGNSWHGTHVGGTVGVGSTNNGTGIAGENWKVTLVPVRVLGKCGGTIADINDGIRWAAGLPVPGVPANSTPARVINMSLGALVPCSQSPATQAAINDAVAAGALVVVSAGNDATDAAGAMPASCNNVMTVAASDARGHLVERYSNFGDVVDILAPGGDVQRDDNGDGQPDGVLSLTDGGYSFANGTSMAAPHVAGVAALAFSQDPSRTAADVENLIKTNALPRSSTECPRPCGAGLLNAQFLRDNGDRIRAYEYAAKLVCGVQPDPDELRLVRGLYATVINVRNPGEEGVRFLKRIELAFPPGGQEQGQARDISEDGLDPGTALSTSCEDLRERVFGGRFPADYIDGFVVIESPESLDVTAVYSSTGLDQENRATGAADVNVVPVLERRLTDTRQ